MDNQSVHLDMRRCINAGKNQVLARLFIRREIMIILLAPIKQNEKIVRLPGYLNSDNDLRLTPQNPHDDVGRKPSARTARHNQLILKGFMARPERFELPTPWFEAKYSIQLSYGRLDCKRY